MKSVFIGLGFLVFGYFSVLFVSELKKVNSYPPTSWITDHSADCAVVLTGKAWRIQEGFDLLSQKQIKKLIISGVNPNVKLDDIFLLRPYYGQIKSSDIILEKTSLTTFGNAQQSLQLMEALSCRDLILVTSRLHMYRAMKTFTAVLPENFPIYPRAVVSGRLEPKPLDLFVETMKSLFYRPWAY